MCIGSSGLMRLFPGGWFLLCSWFSGSSLLSSAGAAEQKMGRNYFVERS